MTRLEQYLDGVEERVGKATPGPWEPCLGSGHNECTAIHFEGNERYPYGLLVADLLPDWALDEKYKDDVAFKEANMNFLCAARTDVPRLVEMLREAVEALKFYADGNGNDEDDADYLELKNHMGWYQSYGKRAREFFEKQDK